MKKLSNINESVWSNIHKRSNGSSERKEDMIKTNIKDMIPVDIGVSVLWADRDLEINEEVDLTFDEIKNFEIDGWRLPMQNEADELLTKAKWSSTKDPHNWARFYQIGITHLDGNIVYFDCEIGKDAEYWEGEVGKNTPDNCWSTFSFKHDGSFFPHTAYSCRHIDEDKCRVRLVREK